MNHTNSLRSLLLLGVLHLPIAHADLPPGISGAWYNPEQSGHGLSIEILSDTRAVVFWYTYDEAGNPLSLYIEGTVDGAQIRGDALAPRGMRFGAFDPADLDLPRWGTVTIDFDDCDHASLSWNADGEAGGSGYGTGVIPMQRLTRIQGSSCALAPPADPPLPVGKVNATITRGGEPGCTPEPASSRAAIDPEGRLWLLERWRTLDQSDLPAVPDLTYVGCQAAPLMASSNALPPGGGVLQFDVRQVSWSDDPIARTLATGELQLQSAGISATASAMEGTLLQSVQLGRTGSEADELSQERDLDDLVGVWRYGLRGQFFESPASFSIDAEGTTCLRTATDGSCELGGRFRPAFRGYAFFDFVFEGVFLQQPVRYEGRAWLQDASATGSVQELVIVGSGDDDRAFGLVAIR